MNYKVGEGVTGQVFSTGQSVCLDGVNEALLISHSQIRDDINFSDYFFYCVPLKIGDEIIGTISVDQKKSEVENGVDNLRFLEEIAQLIAPFVDNVELKQSFGLFTHAKSTGGAFKKLIGNSSSMKEVKKLAAKVANMSTTILIQGETGTGKGVLAEVIHEMSPRNNHAMIEVNCGSIPTNLIESELFGHEKGAFTGAVTHRIGVFERAGKGTIFLDEIGELPLELQTRLLRVLQNQKFERVGGTKTITTEARVIVATNKDLEKEIELGNFRQDLFFRISVFPIFMPSLKTRDKSDIIMLLDYFASYFAKKMKIDIFRFDSPAIDMLTSYKWPGNVRELENIVERAVLLSENGVILGSQLPPSLQMKRYEKQQSPSPTTNLPFNEAVVTFEINLIEEALQQNNGNQSNAARSLGLTQRIMQYKIKKYNINYKSFRK
jgi:Nif-specific regulatory protein